MTVKKHKQSAVLSYEEKERNNYDKVESYIKEQGIKNQDGSRAIENIDTYTDQIAYNGKYQCPQFIYVDDSEAKGTISDERLDLYYFYPEESDAIAEIQSKLYDSDDSIIASFTGSASVNTSIYTDGDDLGWSIIENEGSIDQPDESNDSANISFSLATSGWDEFLEKETGLNLKDIGFVLYE